MTRSAASDHLDPFDDEQGRVSYVESWRLDDLDEFDDEDDEGDENDHVAYDPQDTWPPG